MPKMVIFCDFFKQLGTKRVPVYISSQLGTLQDVRDYKNRNHDDGDDDDDNDDDLSLIHI